MPHVTEVRLADLDGDGRADAIRRNSAHWEVSRSAKEGWRRVASTLPLSELAFGDFDGDGHADIFRRTARETWEVSFCKEVTSTSGDMTRWREVGASNVGCGELAFGDFDGDGHTDVFRKTSRDTWEASFGKNISASGGSMAPWREIGASTVARRE